MLHKQLERAKAKIRSMWKLNCKQFMEHETLIEAKDYETADLKARLRALKGRGSSPDTDHSPSTLSVGVQATSGRMCHGKAPSTDCFTGESVEILLDYWLLALKCAPDWNGWTRSRATDADGRALQRAYPTGVESAQSGREGYLYPCSECATRMARPGQ